MNLRDEREGLTGEMVRAGRAIARIEQSELAAATGLSLETIKRLERIRGVVNANPTTLAALRRAFHVRGVEFHVDETGRRCVLLDSPGETRRITELEQIAPEPSRLSRAIYYSAATRQTLGQAETVLDDILRASIDLNGRLGVTGALAFAGGYFMQALEGPPSAVNEVLGAIAMDRRHQGFTPIERAEVSERRFPTWIMCGVASGGATGLQAFDPRALDGEAATGLLARLAEAEQRALDDTVPEPGRPPHRSSQSAAASKRNR